jgi:hypothetical protein
MRDRLFLGLALVVCIGTPVVYGAEFGQISLEELTLRSDVILTGKCIASQSRWDDQARMVMTDSVFAVDRYLKGQGSATITVTAPGGALPDRNLVMTIPGMVEFSPKEEVLLFLAKTRSRNYTVYGLSQGKFVIQTDAKTADKTVGKQPLTKVLAEVDRINRSRRTN